MADLDAPPSHTKAAPSLTEKGGQKETTYCVLEVCGHAHAQLHLLNGEIQLLTHFLTQRQQHLEGRREKSHIW